jgi:predicted ATPase
VQESDPTGLSRFPRYTRRAMAHRRETRRGPAARLVGVGEAARLLGVSIPTLRRWDRAGKLRARRMPVSGYRAYDRSDIARLVDAASPDPPPPRPAPAVPAVDDFVGRTREVEEALRLVAGGQRLVTLLGPGGIGKTQLACRVAVAAAERLARDAIFCDASEARDAEALVATIADAIGVELPRAGTTVTRTKHLARALACRPGLLLVADNLEQVAVPAAKLVALGLASAPGLQILATSRQRLRVNGERAIEVDPLAEPEATELIARRAPRGSVDPRRDARVLGDIARRLDGIPLALELAAARLGVLSPKELMGRLDERFSVLARGRGRPKRHETLRATIDWSWELLAPAERRALAQASVFRGGFSLRAAEAVVDAGAQSEGVLEIVDALVDRSLLRAAAAPDGSRRFSMYEAIREYAAERLDSGTRASALERHARHFASIAGPAAARATHAPGSVASDLARDRGNLLLAHETSLRSEPREALAIAVVMEHAFTSRVPVLDLVAKLDATLAAAEVDRAAGSENLIARAELVRARLLMERGLLADSARDMDRALRRARTLGDEELEEYALGLRAIAEIEGGRRDAAFETASAAAAMASRHAGDPSRRYTFAHLGSVLHELGEMPRAEESYRRALGLAHRAGDDVFVARILARLGRVWGDTGRVDEAEESFARALAVLEPAGDRYEGWTRGHRAMVARRAGRLDTARAEYQRALPQFAARGALTVEVMHRGLYASVLADLGYAVDAVRELEIAKADRARLDDPAPARVLDVAAGHLDLLEARRAEARGEDATKFLAAARERLGRAEAFVDRDKDVRAAADLLRAALAAHVDGREPRFPTRPSLAVGPGASWLTPPGAARVDLRSREPLRRIAEALVAARLEPNARALSQNDLFAAGWPGERALPRAAAQRVYSALGELRHAGLAAVLLSDRDGYRLDARTPVWLEPA